MLKILALGAVALSSSAAMAATFANGSFELGVAPGSYLSLPNGSTSILGWTVTGSGIDYIGSYWTPSAGSRSLDLNGTAAGGVSQTFETTVSHLYRVTFDLAGNPDSGAALKTMNASVDGYSAGYSFDTTGKSKTSMGWTTHDFTFVADDTEATLTFASTMSGSWGPAIDNVTLEDLGPVPEPASIVAISVGVASLLRRRKR